MKRSALLSALFVVVFVQSILALGALYARRAGSNDSSSALWLTRYNADVKITDQICVTHVDQTFRNEDYFRKEGLFIFPLPENAIVTELAMWIDGKRVVGSVMEKDTARAVYESIVRRRIDPALLEYLGKNVFKLSVFPIEAAGQINSERRIEITYAELLPYDQGIVPYRFYMKTVNFSSKPVQTASVMLDVLTQKKIVSFTSPTHAQSSALQINKISDYQYKAVYGNENAHSESDLGFKMELLNEQYSLNNLTYVPRADSGMFFDAPGDNPYFVMWVTPQMGTVQVMRKNIVFVADISSSMAGVRIDQLRKALNAAVDMLNPFDKFNIIPFSTGIVKFKPDLVTADAANKTAAHTFINNLAELGLTNMEDALKGGLSAAWDDTSVKALVFLTDGNPTWPVGTGINRVIDSAKIYNMDSVKVFPFGIGDDVDKSFLSRLAADHGGFATIIQSSDSISQVFQGFMRKISYPIMKNLVVNYGALTPYDIFPRAMPDLYEGTQVTVLGRYRTAGQFDVSVTGSRGMSSFGLTERLSFPAGTKSHPFVPRMWASAKINDLLSQISMYGEQTELVDGVKFLGRKYSIITPYTSLLVLEPGVIPGAVIENKMARAVQSVKLLGNTPNPFRTITAISYAVPASKTPQRLTLNIYDAGGRCIKHLVDEYTMGGSFLVKWDGTDNAGRRLTGGIYFAVLEIGGKRQMITMKMVR